MCAMRSRGEGRERERGSEGGREGGVGRERLCTSRLTPPLHTRRLVKPETLSQLNGKNVMMYCTGGIRCERASALLKEISATGICAEQPRDDGDDDVSPLCSTYSRVSLWLLADLSIYLFTYLFLTLSLFLAVLSRRPSPYACASIPHHPTQPNPTQRRMQKQKQQNLSA